MAIVTIDESVYGWSSRVMCVITILFALTSLYFHVGKVREAVDTKKISWSKSVIFSIILHISVLIFNSIFIWATWFPATRMFECKIIIRAATLGYLLVKWSLYMCLSYRVDDAFHGSKFGYKSRTLTIWRTIVCIFQLIVVTLVATIVDETLSDDINPENIPCRAVHPRIFLGIVALLDIIACLVNLILFIYPLIKLSHEMKKLNEKEMVNVIKNHAHDGGKGLKIPSSTSINIKYNSNTNYNKTKIGNISPKSPNSPTASAAKLFQGDNQLKSASMQSQSFPEINTNTNANVSIDNNKTASVIVYETSKSVSSPVMSNKNSRNTSLRMKSKKVLPNGDRLLKVAKKFAILTSTGVGTTFFTIVFIGLFDLSALWYVHYMTTHAC